MNRPDFSNFLVHFTTNGNPKGGLKDNPVGDISEMSAYDRLISILNRDIDTVLVLLFLLALLETLVLKVETVFEQALFKKFGDIVQCDMYQYDTHDGREHIEDDMQRQGVEPHRHRMTKQPHRKNEQQHAAHQRVKHLPAGVELQVLFVSRANTRYADKYGGGNLAVDKVAVIVNHPAFDTAVNVHEDTAPVIEHRGINRILEELQQHGDIDHCSEDLVEPLQLFTLFHIFPYYPIFYINSICCFLFTFIGQNVPQR